MSRAEQKQSWLKFNPQDWRGDAKLRVCSISARGLWIEMICVMHEANPYGHLLIGSRAPSVKQIATLAGISYAECERLLAEIEQAGVYSKTEDGVIYSRRMVRDKEKSDRDRSNGKSGGNPTLVDKVNGRVNPPDIQPDKASDKASDKAKNPESRVQIDIAAADARANGGRLVGMQANELAETLLVIAGHNPAFWPPGWCGAPLRVQAWLNDGWPVEIIVAATKSVVARKRGEPAASVQFFEKAIAAEVARQAQPLPVVEISPAEKFTVTHGKTQSRSGSLIDAINREIADLEAEESADPSLPKSPVLRLSK